MNNEQRTFILQFIGERFSALEQRHAAERSGLDTRHDAERRKLESDLAPMSAGLNEDTQPTLFVAPVAVAPEVTDVPFPDERHLYSRGRLLFTPSYEGRPAAPRPRRWRIPGVVEYFYRSHIGENHNVGTAGYHNEIRGRWLTVTELNTIKGTN